MQSLKDLVRCAKRGMKLEEEIENLDIGELLAAGSIDSNYLGNKTLDDITQSIFDIIEERIESEETRKMICDKLVGYRYVDRLCDIRTGRHSRWITQDRDFLHNGGLAVNIKIEDSIRILCKTPSPRYPFVTCDFNKVVFFQKLTEEELFLLMANKMAK
jgi:hypothetical protein